MVTEVADVEWSPVRPDVVVVDDMARRYALVLLSRRTLRALAAATAPLAVFFGLLPVGIPIVMLALGDDPKQGWLLGMLALVVVCGVAITLVGALVYAYVRALAALATGRQGPISLLLSVVVAFTLVVGMIYVEDVFLPGAPAAARFVAGCALFVHLAIAAALIRGPIELQRRDAEGLAVLAEPRVGTGLRAEMSRFLQLPDTRLLTRAANVRAWTFVTLSLMCEGGAFFLLLDVPSQLGKIAESSPSAVGGGSAVLLVAGAAVAVAITFAVARLLLKIGTRWRLKARRQTVATADAIAGEDARPPVLFLRSFEHGQVPLAAARVPWLLRAFDPGTEYRTLEELLVMTLSFLGPVVTAADPAEAETPVGAARWRLAADGWQSFVRDQIAAAGVIVIGLAQTSGLQWEIDAVRRTPGALGKALFVCPPHLTRSAASHAAVAETLGCAGEMTVGEHRHLLAAVRSSSGRPTFFVASTLTELSYYVALRYCLLEQRHPIGVAPAVS
jgi:hypothetical protein